ncbi:MAG: DUF3253 domain-containing protein [Pseudomonadota bacterium]
MATDDALVDAIFDRLTHVGSGKTICPSEAARAVSARDWRPLMPDVKRLAIALAEGGRLEATQRGEVVDLRASRGPYRLRLPRR